MTWNGITEHIDTCNLNGIKKFELKTFNEQSG